MAGQSGTLSTTPSLSVYSSSSYLSPPTSSGVVGWPLSRNSLGRLRIQQLIPWR